MDPALSLKINVAIRTHEHDEGPSAKKAGLNPAGAAREGRAAEPLNGSGLDSVSRHS